MSPRVGVGVYDFGPKVGAGVQVFLVPESELGVLNFLTLKSESRVPQKQGLRIPGHDDAKRHIVHHKTDWQSNLQFEKTAADCFLESAHCRVSSMNPVVRNFAKRGLMFLFSNSY